MPRAAATIDFRMIASFSRIGLARSPRLATFPSDIAPAPMPYDRRAMLDPPPFHRRRRRQRVRRPRHPPRADRSSAPIRSPRGRFRRPLPRRLRDLDAARARAARRAWRHGDGADAGHLGGGGRRRLPHYRRPWRGAGAAPNSATASMSRWPASSPTGPIGTASAPAASAASTAARGRLPLAASSPRALRFGVCGCQA